MSRDACDEETALNVATLGALLLDAGESVTTVRSLLQTVCTSQHITTVELAVLPALVLVTDKRSGATICVNSGTELTFQHAAIANQLPSQLGKGNIRLSDMPTVARRIRESSRPRAARQTIFGNALVAAGFAALFQSPWWAIALAFSVGLAVGVLMSIFERSRPGAALQPFVVSLLSTLLVGAALNLIDFPSISLFAVVAPVVILVPGAVIAKALLELTSTDIVAGAARLLGGLIVMGFMVAGIAAGSALTGLDVDAATASLVGDITRTARDGGWEASPPLWFAWISVVILAVGVNVMFQSGLRLTTASAFIMCTAYGATLLLTPAMGAVVAIGAGSGIVFLAAKSAERIVPAFPAAVTFFPAFLLFVPGTIALVSLATQSEQAVATAFASFASLCIGIHVGGLIDLWLDKTLWKHRRERTASWDHDTH